MKSTAQTRILVVPRTSLPEAVLPVRGLLAEDEDKDVDVDVAGGEDGPVVEGGNFDELLSMLGSVSR